MLTCLKNLIRNVLVLMHVYDLYFNILFPHNYIPVNNNQINLKRREAQIVRREHSGQVQI